MFEVLLLPLPECRVSSMVEAWRLCCRLPRRSLDFTGDIRGKAQDKTILGDIEYP